MSSLRDRLAGVLIGLPRDGEEAMPVEGAGPEHGGQFEPGDAHLPALGDDELVVALDHRKRLLLRRPEVEGDEAAALLLDDQGVAHELG